MDFSEYENLERSLTAKDLIGLMYGNIDNDGQLIDGCAEDPEFGENIVQYRGFGLLPELEHILKYAECESKPKQKEEDAFVLTVADEAECEEYTVSTN